MYSVTGQDSKLLGLVLLENAQLTPNTLQGAKLQLVYQAQQLFAHCSDQSDHREKKCIAKCTQTLSSLKISLPENIQESEETVSDTVMVSRSVYMDIISRITEIRTVLSAKYLGHDQVSASDRPHPILLDDEVHVLQMMTGQVKACVPFQTETESPAPIFLASNNSSLTPTSNRTSLQQINHPDEGASMNSLRSIQDAMLIIVMVIGKETSHVRRKGRTQNMVVSPNASNKQLNRKAMKAKPTRSFSCPQRVRPR
jgi:hypothetical protein